MSWPSSSDTQNYTKRHSSNIVLPSQTTKPNWQEPKTLDEDTFATSPRVSVHYARPYGLIAGTAEINRKQSGMHSKTIAHHRCTAHTLISCHTRKQRSTAARARSMHSMQVLYTSYNLCVPEVQSYIVKMNRACTHTYEQARKQKLEKGRRSKRSKIAELSMIMEKLSSFDQRFTRCSAQDALRKQWLKTRLK